MKNVKITRRSFLLGLGAASSALLLSACGSTDAPASSASTSALPQHAETACSSCGSIPFRSIYSATVRYIAPVSKCRI